MSKELAKLPKPPDLREAIAEKIKGIMYPYFYPEEAQKEASERVADHILSLIQPHIEQAKQEIVREIFKILDDTVYTDESGYQWVRMTIYGCKLLKDRCLK